MSEGDDTQAVFVFDADCTLSIFESLRDAERDSVVAQLPVRGHRGVFLADGTAVNVEVESGAVVLRPSGRSRLHDLEWRLAEWQRTSPVVPSRVDPAAFARRWLARGAT